MTPVTQTLFGKPDGNCFAACVASLLDLPLEVVPNVMRHEDWYARFNWWLKRRGMYLCCFDGWPQGFVRDYYSDVHILVYGMAERGIDHACVYRGTELAWDPHPDRSGLIGEPKGWEVIAISDLTLARTRRATP
jgi:hypothetical protein